MTCFQCAKTPCFCISAKGLHTRQRVGPESSPMIARTRGALSIYMSTKRFGVDVKNTRRHRYPRFAIEDVPFAATTLAVVDGQDFHECRPQMLDLGVEFVALAH